MSSNNSSQFAGVSLQDIFIDLASRFVINLPPDELSSIERICFQVEQCHWFYDDFVRPGRPDLPNLQFRKFAELFLTQCSSHLPAFDYNPKTAIDAFMAYKSGVPVRGAILMNRTWDKVVLVKGWKSSSAWGFPKGKINQNEDDRDCAVREVWEEIGYDISPHFDSSRKPSHQDELPAPMRSSFVDADDFIDLEIQGQQMRLFIVLNVEEDAVFITKTRKEISKIDWFRLNALPGWTKQSSEETASSNRKFYLVAPVMRGLRSWISRHKHLKGFETLAPRESEPDQTQPVRTEFADVEEGSRALQAFFLGTMTLDRSNSPTLHSTPLHALNKEMPGEAREQAIESGLSKAPSSNILSGQQPKSEPEKARDALRSKLLNDLDLLVGMSESPSASVRPIHGPPNEPPPVSVPSQSQPSFQNFHTPGQVPFQHAHANQHVALQPPSAHTRLPTSHSHYPLTHKPQRLPTYQLNNPDGSEFHQHMLLSPNAFQQPIIPGPGYSFNPPTQYSASIPIQLPPVFVDSAQRNFQDHEHQANSHMLRQGPPQNQYHSAMYLQPQLPLSLSQPTPIRPIPLLSYGSPLPSSSQLPSDPQTKAVPAAQSAALLSLLNMKATSTQPPMNGSFARGESPRP